MCLDVWKVPRSARCWVVRGVRHGPADAVPRRSSSGVQLTISARFNAPPAGAPLLHAVFHPLSAVAFLAQQVDGVECHDAVRTAAIRNDVLSLGQIAEALFQLPERKRDRTGDVAGEVLLAWADIDDRHVTRTHAAQEFVVSDGFQRAPFLQVLPTDLFDFRQTGFCERPQVEEKRGHLRIGESIGDVQARFFGVYETGASQHLEVVRGVRDALSDLGGEGLDRPRSLGQQIQELEPAGAGRGLANPSDVLVDGGLESRWISS